MVKLGSLFDGIGTFPLSGLQFGFAPIWASEIEAFPIAVTKHHFPDMKHLGDITKINGAEIEPVDVITFGSPCQDMSVAGKREGLAGERSGLFMEAVRIIREMRTATGGQYPRFAVWENVPGAYSSNNGQDFRAVLEEIAEAEIPMPGSGKWATAGMVRTERVDVAWRTLDAQHWGVPQRRKRIFLVADFGGQCAGEILFKSSCVSWNPKTSREKGKEAAATAGDGIRVAGFKSEQSAQARGIGWQEEIAPTLPAEGATPCICLNNQGGRINCTPEGITGAVSSKWAKGTGGPVGDECYNLVIEPRSQDTVVSVDCRNLCESEELSGTLQSKNNGGYSLNYQNPVRKGLAVRRLTPLECERLQGLPDNWTNIEGASNTARYKAIGNGIAKPCSDFVIGRIAEVLRRAA